MTDDAYESPGIRSLRLAVQELLMQVQELRAKVTACEVRQIEISEMIEDRAQH